jgi:hypothetical protein
MTGDGQHLQAAPGRVAKPMAVGTIGLQQPLFIGHRPAARRQARQHARKRRTGPSPAPVRERRSRLVQAPLAGWCYLHGHRTDLELLARHSSDKYGRKRLASLLRDAGDQTALEDLADLSGLGHRVLISSFVDDGMRRSCTGMWCSATPTRGGSSKALSNNAIPGSPERHCSATDYIRTDGSPTTLPRDPAARLQSGVPVPLGYSIASLTCAIASRLVAVMAGWPGTAQDRLLASSPDTRPGCPGIPHRPGEGR